MAALRRAQKPCGPSLSEVRKESLEVVRDPSSIAIGILMPVFLILLFGYWSTAHRFGHGA
jgi:hypothetical protein